MQERFTGRVSLSPPCHTAVQQLMPGPHSWCSRDLTSQEIQKEHWRGFLSIKFLQQDNKCH